MIPGRRILAALAVAGLAAWSLWLAPLQRPRVVLNDIDAHHLWFSADSRFLATAEHLGDKGSRLQIWSVADGQPGAVLDDGGEEFSYLTFSPDGSEAAGLAETGLIVTWDTPTGKVRERLNRHLKLADPKMGLYLPPITYTSSGTLLMMEKVAFDHDPQVVRFVEAATGKEARTIEVIGVAKDAPPFVLPGDRVNWLAALSGNRLLCFDLATGQKQADLPLGFPIAGMYISANGAVIARRNPQSLEVWFAHASENTWRTFPGLQGGHELALSPDGQWLAGKLWSLHSYRPWYERWLPEPKSSIAVVQVQDGREAARYSGGVRAKFAPDGKTLAVGGNEPMRVELWDFPPRRAWLWILGGAMAAGVMTCHFLAWRARQRTCKGSVIARPWRA